MNTIGHKKPQKTASRRFFVSSFFVDRNGFSWYGLGRCFLILIYAYMGVLGDFGKAFLGQVSGRKPSNSGSSNGGSDRMHITNKSMRGINPYTVGGLKKGVDYGSKERMEAVHGALDKARRGKTYADKARVEKELRKLASKGIIHKSTTKDILDQLN